MEGGIGWTRKRSKEPSAEVTVPMHVTGGCGSSWAVLEEMAGADKNKLEYNYRGGITIHSFNTYLLDT